MPPNFELQQLQRCNSEGSTTRKIILLSLRGFKKLLLILQAKGRNTGMPECRNTDTAAAAGIPKSRNPGITKNLKKKKS